MRRHTVWADLAQDEQLQADKPNPGPDDCHATGEQNVPDASLTGNWRVRVQAKRAAQEERIDEKGWRAHRDANPISPAAAEDGVTVGLGTATGYSPRSGGNP